MNKRVPVLVLFLVLFVLAVAAAASYFFLQMGRPAVSVPAHAYLEIGLSGEIREIAPARLLPGRRPGRPHAFRPRHLDELPQGEGGRPDRRRSPPAGHARLRLGQGARSSGTPSSTSGNRERRSIAYIEEAPEFDKEYYLATACDRIVLHPMGWLGVNGIGGYVPFFKNALERLGIKAEFEHVEEYKTAYNQFTETGFTPAHREMMESLYGDMFEQYVAAVAAARKKTAG